MQILFLQGGGAGTYDEWDAELVGSLERELGDAYAVRYPRLPHEEDPIWAAWGPTIRHELAALDDTAVVIGHSVGGTLLVQALVDRPQRLAGIVLIAAPYVGAGGWPGDDELPDDLGARLPAGAWVHVFHGLADETVPPTHSQLYARAIGQAHVHLLPGRDHQLDGDLADVAEVLRLETDRAP